MPQTRPSDWDTPLDLLSVQYSTAPPVIAPAIPATLRRIKALDPAKSRATRVLVLSQGLINGKMMDMNRVDVSARLGDTEIWQLENVVGMDHPFHLHGFQFQVLDRNGVPEKQRRWKDTVNVPKHESVRIIVRYDDNPGKWMFHCHILDHEDHGMMGILEVK
jgi:Putative multicopper oxidases